LWRFQMRLYAEASEETLRARKLMAEWRDESLITKEQYERLQKETASALRTTNIFLRLVFFFFTVVGVGAIAGLFGVSVLEGSSETTIGVFSLLYAALCYWVAERAASQANLYRYGIEEALAVCSVVFLCLGI